MNPIAPSATIKLPLHRFSEFAFLSLAEIEAVKALGEAPSELRKGAIIRNEGAESVYVFLLVKGWASASVACLDGWRQIVKVHLPGDLLGTPSISTKDATETLIALTPVVVSRVSIKKFGEMIAGSTRLAILMLLSAQRERIALMDSLKRIGQSMAAERAAAMLLDLFERLSAIDLAQDGGFDLLLTQEQIGEVLGLSAVHVNRTFRRLQQDGLITRHGRRVQVEDMKGLQELAGWSQRRWASHPEWLPAPPQ